MSQENVEIVREIYQAVARRDAASAFAVYADDIVWEVSAGRALVMDRVYHGHEGVRKFWRDALSAFGEVDLDVEELIDAGDQVVVGSTLRGRGRQSGAQAKFTFWQVWTVQNGKFVRGQGFASREEALEAAGLRE